MRKTALDRKKQPKRIRLLKLYVWENISLFGFYKGIIYVLAHSEKEARKLIAQKYPSHKAEALKDVEPKVVAKPEVIYGVYQGGD